MAALIYVSGPYNGPTLERKEENVEKAIEAGRDILVIGAYPLIPHLNHLYSQHFTRRGIPDLTHEQYLDWDKEILTRCDALYKLGNSPGADEEEQTARDNEIPVFTDFTRLSHFLTCDECQSDNDLAVSYANGESN